MNWHATFGLLSGIIFALSGSYYVLDVFKGKVHPNVASFAIWSFINISQLASLIVAHVWSSIPLTLIGTIAAILVVVGALKNKKFYFTRLDLAAFVLGVIGLLVWAVTKQAAWNIYVLQIVGTITFIPLIVKGYTHPQFESVTPWRINLLGSIVLLFAVPSWTLVQGIVPIKQLLCSVALNASMMWGRHDQKAKS